MTTQEKRIRDERSRIALLEMQIGVLNPGDYVEMTVTCGCKSCSDVLNRLAQISINPTTGNKEAVYVRIDARMLADFAKRRLDMADETDRALVAAALLTPEDPPGVS